MRAPRWWIGIAALALPELLSGCTALEPLAVEVEVPARSPEGLAMAVVSFRDHLGWPFRTRRLLIALDGELLFEGMPDGQGVLGAVDLVRGWHDLRVLLTAVYPSGIFGDDDECAVVVGRGDPFFVSGDPIDIDVRAGSGSVTLREEDRIALRTSIDGAGGGEGDGCPFGGWTHVVSATCSTSARSIR